jgi:hypothetical protein
MGGKVENDPTPLERGERDKVEGKKQNQIHRSQQNEYKCGEN